MMIPNLILGIVAEPVVWKVCAQWVVHVLTGLALYTGIYFEEACITRQLSLVGRRAKPGLMVRDVDNELRLALFPYLASIIS